MIQRKFIAHGHSVYRLESCDDKILYYRRYDNDEGRDDIFWIFSTPDAAAKKADELEEKFRALG